MIDYTIDAAAAKKLAANNIHVEKSDDRTTITFMHDVEMESTGKDGDGKSLTIGKTTGRRVNIGYTEDGKGIWLQCQLAQWKEAKQEKRSSSKTADEVAALRAQVEQLTALATAALQGNGNVEAAAPVTEPAQVATSKSAQAPKGNNGGNGKGNKSKSRRRRLDVK